MELKPLFQDIANAIREKDGSTGKIVAEAFPSAIRALDTNGLPDGTYTITLAASDPAGGTVSGGGVASAGMSITVIAYPSTKYIFVGWYEDSKNVSTDNVYSFTVNTSKRLIAQFILLQYTAGIDWWAIDLPIQRDWSSIAYGNGVFVAAGSKYRESNTKLIYSSDGVNWTTATTSTHNGSLTRVVYGDSIFILLIDGMNFVFTSSDGAKWTVSKYLSYSMDDGAFIYAENKFIVAQYHQIIFSEDKGVTWKSATDEDIPSYKKAFIYANKKFVAVGYNYSDKKVYARCSADLVHWESKIVGIDTSDIMDIAYGNNVFVAVGMKIDDNSKGVILYSYNGLDWQSVALPENTVCVSSVAYGSNKFVAVCDGTVRVAIYSVDGINWTTTPLPITISSRVIDYLDNKFITLATNVTRGIYSYDMLPDGSV